MGTDYQGNCTPGTNQKIFLKKSVPVVQMEKISQFLPKNGPKMAKYLQKKFCTPGTPNILGKKKLYPGYTKKIGAKKTVPRVHQKKFGAKNLYHGYKFQNNLGKKIFRRLRRRKIFVPRVHCLSRGGTERTGTVTLQGGNFGPKMLVRGNVPSVPPPCPCMLCKAS